MDNMVVLIHTFQNFQNRITASIKYKKFKYMYIDNASYALHVHSRGRIQREGRGSGPPPPLKIYKNIGFLSYTGSESPENQKATKPAALLGHHWPASETSIKWIFAGGPIMANV